MSKRSAVLEPPPTAAAPSSPPEDLAPPPELPPLDPAEEAALDDLQRLGQADRAYSDLADAIEAADRELERFLGNPWPPYPRESLLQRFALIAGRVRVRTVLAGRLEALARRLGRPYPDYLAPTVNLEATLDRLHFKLLEDAPHYCNELRGTLDAALREASIHLANDEALGRITAEQAAAGVAYAGFASAGALLDASAAAARERVRQRARRDLLEAERAAHEARERATVADLITEAGGEAAVAAAVREALLVAGRLHDDDQETPRLRQLVTDLESLKAQSATAIMVGATGSRRRLDEQAQAVEAEILALREAIDGRRTEAIRADVAAAIAGDVAARTKIVAAARTIPTAFERPDFADHLAAAGSVVDIGSIRAWLKLRALDGTPLK